MPTLMFVPDSVTGAGNSTNTSRNEGAAEDGSTTMYNSDESTLLDENVPMNRSHTEQCNDTTTANRNVEKVVASPILRQKHNKSVTFDESLILLSTGKRGGYSRRDTLNSDVSLLSCDTSHVKNRSTFQTDSIENFPNHATKRENPCRERRRPRRDEYNEKYQSYVKTKISEFESKFPGKLRDYRKMSLEEKALEQERVMELLARLGVSKTSDFRSNSMAIESPSVCARSGFKSPALNSRLIDETLSPLFSPNPNVDERSIPPFSAEQREEDRQNSLHLDQSRIQCEKSELLLSMDDGDVTGHNSRKSNYSMDNQDPSRNLDDNAGSDFDFPVNKDEDDATSYDSMEVVRRAAGDESHCSDKRLSCMTPEGKASNDKLSRKRGASSSGKRGADMRRSRHHEVEENIGHRKENEIELCEPFGRLSISPSLSTPPKDLFVTSQSPISPRLTYNSANDNGNDDDSGCDYMNRISLGRDSINYRESNRGASWGDSNVANDSLATNTPTKRYRSEKDKRRAFRDVPVNVVLKKGATFHLEKIAMKHSERISSRTGSSKNLRAKATQRRRFVNFPDPLGRYSSRRRRALKEMYSWVKRAENEYKDGRSIIPAVGAFFSLSEQQIIDVSLKLFLSDYAENSHQAEPASALNGNTLVVVRTKEDTGNWESALRDGTGCSVLNHSSLPLSERIRGSTAEKACMYDVVLTTYDAMKSPDITIPVTNTGRAILKKPETEGGWHSSRTTSQTQDGVRQEIKKMSVLHRIQFKRVIFVDTLGRKCYLAKGGTARATASVALSSSSCRLVFFKETEADGQNALLALRKSDKRAFQSVSSVLHLSDQSNKSSSNTNDISDNETIEDPLANISMDLKDLVC